MLAQSRIDLIPLFHLPLARFSTFSAAAQPYANLSDDFGASLRAVLDEAIAQVSRRWHRSVTFDKILPGKRKSPMKGLMRGGKARTTVFCQ